MNSKSIFFQLFIFIAGVLAATSCSDFLDTKSDRLLYIEDNTLQTSADTVYSLMGIMSQVQKLGDSYVVLGEMRGDLMDVTENTDNELRAISNFDFSLPNRFINEKDYYAVINNCNYYIQHVDTGIVVKAEKVMYREFAAAKAYRAWAYMQLALNFGKASYFEKPLLGLSDSIYSYPRYSIEQLADTLIQDLLPWQTISAPGYGLIAPGLYTTQLVIPVRFLLGELYLWKGDYTNAATMYYNLIKQRGAIIDNSYQTSWNASNPAGYALKNWSKMFTEDYSSNKELFSVVGYCNQFNNLQQSELPVLSSSYQIKPSQVAVDLWESQSVPEINVKPLPGDLRGEGSSFIKTSDGQNRIMKYPLLYPNNDEVYISKVPICRNGLLYLRLAECLNLLEKPSLAYALLKYGLTKTTVNTVSKVSKVEYNKAPLFDFSTGVFSDNAAVIGFHSRGSGDTGSNPNYKFPTSLNHPGGMADSIRFVQDALRDELGLETAFEGHRFTDLMRFAKQRGDNEYLAIPIASKHIDDYERIKTLLSEEKNWYLPSALDR